jgi:transcriptional regulator with XRE-family HTH domain
MPPISRAAAPIAREAPQLLGRSAKTVEPHHGVASLGSNDQHGRQGSADYPQWWRRLCALIPATRLPIQLTCAKPIPGEIADPRTVGDHLRNQRLARRVTQTQVAAVLQVSPFSLLNWETGRHAPATRWFPAIIAFLGYNPLPEPKTTGQRIKRERMSRGLSARRLAVLACVDESTVARVEHDEPRLLCGPRARILDAIGVHSPARVDPLAPPINAFS